MKDKLFRIHRLDIVGSKNGKTSQNLLDEVFLAPFAEKKINLA